MKFALIDDKKVEAFKGAKGFCQNCGAEMIAKCGELKVNHWAHKRKRQCDSWWENETEWHRNWKENYPIAWQEVIQFDYKTKEKHIADVYTDNGLVIEFQHSRIEPEERRKREDFYKNMVWVVDGTRLKRDFPRFSKEWKSDGISDVHKTNKPKIFEIWFPEFCFPESWLHSTVPVIFDYYGNGFLEDPHGLRKKLYCLFPKVGKHVCVAEISRTAFINATINGEWTSRVQKFINDYKEQDAIEQQKKQQQTTSHSSNKITYTWRGIPLIGGNREYKRRLWAQNKSTRKGRR